MPSVAACRENRDGESRGERRPATRGAAPLRRGVQPRAACPRRGERGGRETIGSDRPRDVFQLLDAEIGEALLQPVAHLPVCVFGEASASRFTNAL
jgi:hypothetical protein